MASQFHITEQINEANNPQQKGGPGTCYQHALTLEEWCQMHTKPPTRSSNTLSRVRSYMDDLHGPIAELEALANCARSALDGLPHFTRLAGHSGGITAREEAADNEARRNYTRLQVLVFAAAEASDRLMDAYDRAIDLTDKDLDDFDAEEEAAAAENDDDDDDDGNGGSSGPAAGSSGQPGGPGSPGAFPRGHGSTPPHLTTPPA